MYNVCSWEFRCNAKSYRPMSYKDFGAIQTIYLLTYAPKLLANVSYLFSAYFGEINFMVKVGCVAAPFVSSGLIDE